ncbi:class I SAM-dependent methyltransferase [Cohnella sp. WQ 127256]|uniref:class I SAM-dependent methyltransferase n=1 Tax=Cohnella sp. WQ 127256 TaxID=2938790 RepID=UPI0021182CB6|nr:SAM-dependent methyltransferase [Cohnella sp. WQ 127256]
MEADFSETSLTAIIKETILDSQLIGILDAGMKLSAIPFHQYMTLCLYHPDFGYYRAGTSRVGREGDFYTSAYVGELMGEQLASELSRHAKRWFAEDDTVEIIDWGGGTGRLSRQMLDAWNIEEVTDGRDNPFFLTVVEGNPEHRRLASLELDSYIQAGKARVISREEGEGLNFGEHPVMVVANELLDAFPTYRIVQREGKLWEWGVAWQEGVGLISCLLELDNPRLKNWISDNHISLMDNQSIEINLDAGDWVADLAGRLEQAIVIFIDYGDETEELISAHRMDGTLMCYYQHRAHNDPFRMPGEQDLTSHVNFSHIRKSAESQGLQEQWYGSQKRFLVESGLLEKLVSHTHTDPFHPVVRRNRAIRQLLLSDGMSELFKVQVLLKI